ncbi:hypothetical protein [Niallia circulans]|nr:hypothetical protein [Niallia circulans]
MVKAEAGTFTPAKLTKRSRLQKLFFNDFRVSHYFLYHAIKKQ